MKSPFRWAEIRLEIQYPDLSAGTWDPKWKFIGAWSTRGLTHVVRTTNIVIRIRALFHFQAGFTGQRDYQSRGRARSFLNLRSLHDLRSRRGLDVIEDSATVKIAVRQSRCVQRRNVRRILGETRENFSWASRLVDVRPLVCARRNVALCCTSSWSSEDHDFRNAIRVSRRRQWNRDAGYWQWTRRYRAG